MVLPKSESIPALYVLITTQTKREWATTKCGHEWDCGVLLDLIGNFQNGFVDRSVVDDIESRILTAIDTWTFTQTDITIPPFTVYNTMVDDSHDDFLSTPTGTIVRKLVRFRHFISAVNFVVS